MRKGFLATLRDAIGQLLVVGFEGVEADAGLRRLLGEIRPGGVILFARNMVDAAQTHALLSECQRVVGAALYRCVDLEGGSVDRLREIVGPSPSAADVAATGSPELYRAHGRVLGEQARALGFNVDFAPVLDLGMAASKQVLGTRTASSDALGVVDYGRQFLLGLREAGVLGCGKHFPGLGSASLDSHLELPVIEKPWARLWEEDLLPYRYLRRRMTFCMVAHAAYPQVTKDHTPASVSKKWITGILRKRVGYGGIIVSDDLEMGGALAAGPVEKLAVAAIEAGADMLLVCRQEEMVRRAFDGILYRAQRDVEFRQKVQAAALRERFIKSRHRLMLAFQPPPSAERVEELRKGLARFANEVRLGTL